MIGRAIATASIAMACAVASASPVLAWGQGPNDNGNGNNPIPSSQAQQEIGSGALQTNVSGQLIEPIPPATIPPMRPDPGPTTTAPKPPSGCAPGFAYLGASGETTIYPTFTRNASGGYDGYDGEFGYASPDAVPNQNPGLLPAMYPVTSQNIAGHIIGVTLAYGGPGSIPAVSPIPGVPHWIDGSCDDGAIEYSFSPPFIAGDQPPASPPANVIDTPTFPLGAALAANVMGRWRIGTVDTLPGPGETTRTFVHIPTCAWLDSDVPQSPTVLRAIKSTTYLGYTFFLIYTVTVTPGAVTWDWGDGTQTASDNPPQSAPPTLPAYDASSQTWSNSCTLSHAYATVSAGRTITATQTFTTAVDVTWSDGVNANSATVACDPATKQPCVSTIGAAQGWSSGPHPVDQIEPIPFNPPAAA